MATVKARGYEFNAFNIKGSSSRRAVLFQNNIIGELKKIGVHEDDIEVKLETVAIRKAPASVAFYLEGQHLFFSYNKSRFIENLYVVSKVIEFEVKALLNKEKTIEEFMNDFSEDEDIDKKRKEARVTLGVEKDSTDLEEINRKYKILAKEHHPDMGGSMEEFKKINTAHKILKKELE